MATTITVFGATGNQGGSVARSLLQSPAFHVRAVTRNPSSEASRSLASSGAEIVQADGFNREEVLAAFRGSWGAFVNLNSDDKIFKNPDGPTELDLGKIIVDAAVEAGVKHLVFSSGPPCVEMTGGKVRMKAMQMKNEIEQYASQPGKFATVTPINAGWYLENFLSKEAAPIFGGFPHIIDDEGYLTFRVPHWGGDNQVPFLSVREDYGDIVHGIFLDPARYNGHVVHGASHLLSFDQLVADFEEATGRKSRFEPILPSWEAFDTLGIAEMDDVKLMFGFAQNTGGRYFGREPSETRTAAELKKATAVALGRPEVRGQLMTPKEWFKAQFATQG